MAFVMGGHIADTFRAGRGFLVGDAAHRTTPVGTLGMNTAIQGAHNLGWKLAWVLRGWAGEALLDSYEAERRPIGTRQRSAVAAPRSRIRRRRPGLGHRRALRIGGAGRRRRGSGPRTPGSTAKVAGSPPSTCSMAA